MVGLRERGRAVKAIQAAWPGLLMKSYSEVVRFLDPNDPGLDGQPRPAIDIMLPFGQFQQTILKDYVTIDAETQHHIPSLEAALVSKYAAMISIFRLRGKKEQDAVDFRRIVLGNHDRINRESLRRLAAEVWSGGANEIEQFLAIALSEQPFPV